MPFPLIAAAVGAAGSIGGAFLNKSAADDAAAQQRQTGRFVAQRSIQAGQKGARASKKAAKQQITGLRRGYGQAQGYLDPYYESGTAGQDLYSDLLGVNGVRARDKAHSLYESSPGFQDAVDYGIDQAQQSAAAGGNLFSGGTLTELAARGQRQRLDDFYRWRDELEGLGRTGLGVANTLADYGYSTERDVGSTRAGGTLGAANARIGGMLSATNAIAGGQQNASALGMYGQGQMAQGINNVAGRFSSPLSNVIGKGLGLTGQA